jgi:hypothetical protein
MLWQIIFQTIAVPILFLLPGYVVTTIARRSKLSGEDNALYSLFSWVSLSIVFTSMAGLALAELGQFALWKLVLLVFSVASGLLVILKKSSLYPLNQLSDVRLSLRQALLLFFPLVLAGLLFSHPFENMWGGRDGGVYVNTGINIARTGTIDIRDDLFAQLPKDSQPSLLWTPPDLEKTDIRFKYPGFYWLADKHLVVPQFLHLYPVWIAIFYSLFGINGCFLATSVFAWLSVWALYLVATALWGEVAGFCAAMLLVASPAQVWFSRYANSDILFQFLFLAGVFFWVMWQRRSERWLAAASALCFGALFLTHIEAILLIVPLGLVLWTIALSGWRRSNLLYFIIPFIAVVCWAAWHVLAFAYPYVRMMAFLTGLNGTKLVIMVGSGMIAGAVLLSTVLLPGSVKAIRRLMAMVRLYRTSALLLVSLLVIGVVYLYFTGERNLVKLGWYLTPLGLLLAFVGMCVSLATDLNRQTAMLLLVAIMYGGVLLYQPGISPDHIWAARRFIPVIIPSAALFAGYLLSLPLPGLLEKSGEQGTQSAKTSPHHAWWPRLTARLVARGLSVGIAVLLIVGLMQTTAPLLRHREFDDAVVQTQRVANLFPEHSLIVLDGSWVGNFLSLPLQFLYGQETVAFWPRDGQPAHDLAALEAISAIGLAQGRNVFFVSTVPWAVSSERYRLTEIAQSTLVVPQLEHSADHFPRKIEIWNLPFRVYRITLVEDKITNSPLEKC